MMTITVFERNIFTGRVTEEELVQIMESEDRAPVLPEAPSASKAPGAAA